MSNIEPLLNAVDTLIEIINAYDSTGRRNPNEIWDSLISQADFVSGMTHAYRAINKTNQPIMKRDQPVTTSTYRSKDEITFTNGVIN